MSKMAYIFLCITWRHWLEMRQVKRYRKLESAARSKAFNRGFFL